MISTLCWVSKGAAAAEPELFEMSREDLAKLKDKMEKFVFVFVCFVSVVVLKKLK